MKTFKNSKFKNATRAPGIQSSTPNVSPGLRLKTVQNAGRPVGVHERRDFGLGCNRVRPSLVSTVPMEEESPLIDLHIPSGKPSSSVRSSLCRHARADGCTVFGSSWETTLAQTVVDVRSNANGSVIVVGTEDGKVSLFRGSDGILLVARDVGLAEDGSLPIMVWLDGVDAEGTEALLVETPSDDESTKFIMVSKIDGTKLNAEDPSVVRVAVANMKVSTLELPADVGAMRGYFDGQSIRLLACYAEGSLSIFDYDTINDQVAVVESTVDWGDNEDVFVDFQVGLLGQKVNAGEAQRLYYIGTAYTESCAFCYWFDPASRQVGCRWPIETKGKRPKVLALEVLGPRTMALAIKVDRKVEIRVLQIVVEEILGLVSLKAPHVVCTIPLESAVKAVELAAEDFLTFRIKSKRSDMVRYQLFCPPTESSRKLAEVKHLLAMNQFDQVDELLVDANYLSLMQVKYADFSLSEVAWKRLHSLLGESNETLNANKEAVFDQVRDCLRRLATSALVSDGPEGSQYLARATSLVLESMSEPTLGEASMILSMIVSTLESVVNVLGDEQLVRQKRQLEARLAAVDILLEIISGAEGAALRLAEPYDSVRSVSHLFALLVESGHFGVAELLWNKARDQLSPDALVRAMLKVDAGHQPRAYASLLSQVVLPSLSIGSEFLDALRAWSCRTADDLDETAGDEEESGLDRAILLLEVRCCLAID